MKRLVLILVCAIVASSASALYIDDFSASSIDRIYGTTAAPIVDGPPLAGVLGLSRTTEFSTPAQLIDLGGGNFYCSSNVAFYAPFGSAGAAINNGAGVYGAATFSYDNFIVEFTPDDIVKVKVDPDHAGFGKSTIIRVTIGDGTNSATLEEVWTTADYITDSYEKVGDTWVKTFNAYLDPEFSGADFKAKNAALDLLNISEISVYIETDSAGDYLIEGFETTAEFIVPEPATIGLLGIGALSLLKRRRA